MKLSRRQALLSALALGATATSTGCEALEACQGNLASLVMTINFGLRVQSRQNQSQQALKPIIENSLSVLGLAA